MGLRFRRSVKIAPGVRLNFGKKSTSVSFGGKGARYTVSSTGKKTASVGIPGTGLSYVETINGKNTRKDNADMSRNKEQTSNKSSKSKKPFFKKWWFWLIVIFVVIGSAASTSEDSSTNDSSTNFPNFDSSDSDIVTTEQTDPSVTEEDEGEEPVVEPEPDPEQTIEQPSEEPDGQTPPQEPEGTTYILNTNTMKFHEEGCPSVKDIKDHNKSVFTGNRDDVISMGYDPCGRCKP